MVDWRQEERSEGRLYTSKAFLDHWINNTTGKRKIHTFDFGVDCPFKLLRGFSSIMDDHHKSKREFLVTDYERYFCASIRIANAAYHICCFHPPFHLLL